MYISKYPYLFYPEESYVTTPRMVWHKEPNPELLDLDPLTPEEREKEDEKEKIYFENQKRGITYNTAIVGRINSSMQFFDEFVEDLIFTRSVFFSPRYHHYRTDIEEKCVWFFFYFESFDPDFPKDSEAFFWKAINRSIEEIKKDTSLNIEILDLSEKEWIPHEIKTTNRKLTSLVNIQNKKITSLTKRRKISSVKAKVVRFFSFVDIDEKSKCHSNINNESLGKLLKKLSPKTKLKSEKFKSADANLNNMIEESQVFNKHLNQMVDEKISNNFIDYLKKALGDRAESLLYEYSKHKNSVISLETDFYRFRDKLQSFQTDTTERMTVQHQVVYNLSESLRIEKGKIDSLTKEIEDSSIKNPQLAQPDEQLMQRFTQAERKIIENEQRLVETQQRIVHNEKKIIERFVQNEQRLVHLEKKVGERFMQNEQRLMQNEKFLEFYKEQIKIINLRIEILENGGEANY